MGTLQIRHFPDDVKEILKERAAGNKTSLSEYSKQILEDHAKTPTMADFFDHLKTRNPTKVTSTVEVVRELRGE